MLNQVHIVFKSGPEWYEPVACYEKKAAAEKETARRNGLRNEKNVIDFMSTYVVHTMNVNRQD